MSKAQTKAATQLLVMEIVRAAIALDNARRSPKNGPLMS